MSAPILATKLYIPLPRSKIVLRSHLIERLNEGLHRKLTLISAPVGFGKTTLLSEWVASCRRPVAWLSLDDEDKDPTRFLIYLVTALQTVVPNIGEQVLAALLSPQQPPIESMLIALLNELSTFPNEFILILDDYHAVDSQPVDNALTFLLEHLPPQLHLVIASREDPQLLLARYRARDQSTELRIADLRFSPAEAAEFLNQVMGLNLSEADIVALETRTEGWIAGLQLAAISMKGHADTSSFIQSFTGSHRFIMDYLVEEVLRQQPENVQDFLLYTSILGRLCGPLCEAVLLDPSAIGQETTGQETLEYLERANMFIVPLDNERRWYRYHHLFAELLQNRLNRTYPDQIAELHRRASDWHAQNDLPNEAVTHALAIQDWPRAAEIIEQYSDIWPMRGEIRTVLGWLESFPAEIWLKRVKLGVNYAWALFMANQFERADQLLDQLMPLAQNSPPIMGELFAIRVMIAANRYDLPAAIELAQQALSLVPPEEASPRSRILLSLGFAYHEMGGDIAAAKSAFREAFELGKTLSPGNQVGNAPLPLTALAYLSEIEGLQGNLREASRLYNQALELAEQWGKQPSFALSLIQGGRAGLLYEWNDLEGAAGALQESIHIGELWKSPYFLVNSFGLSALVLLARGQMDDAYTMIRRAEQITRDSYSSPSDLGSLARYQIILWIADDDYRAIMQWEQHHDPDWQSKIGRVHHNLSIVLVRACLARYYRLHENSALSRARGLIEPALEHAQTSGLMLHVVRLLILDALARYAQGETSSAISTLERALVLAEPENYVRSFLDLGTPMEEFLMWSLESRSLSAPHLREYVSKLVSHFGNEYPADSSRPAGEALIEPLTARELEVLRLIAQGLSNREIGERLFLALSTIKGHNRIIFDKLHVQSRTEAVARARELGLL